MQRKVSVLWGEKKVVLRQTPRAVTPFGGLSAFIEFLKRIGFAERVRQDLPFCLSSPNAIPAGETFTAFSDRGGGGSAAICAQLDAAGRPRLAPCWG